MKTLQEAYQEVYYTEEHFIADLSDICTEYFFESQDDSNYFVEQLLEHDLLDEFLLDFSEELDVDIAYYLEENIAAVGLRGVINALSAAGRSKAGLSALSALGKSGNILKGSSASSSIRSARAASRSINPPSSQLPNVHGTASKLKAANAYSASTRAKMGATSTKPGTIKVGGEVKPTAASTGAFPTKTGGAIPKGGSAASAIRKARAGSDRTVYSSPSSPTPGRYIQALQSKRAARGLPPAGQTTAGSSRATRQRATTAGWERDRAAKQVAQTVANQAATVARGFMKALKQGNARSKLSTAAAGTKGTGVRIGQPSGGARPLLEPAKPRAIVKSSGGALVSRSTPSASSSSSARRLTGSTPKGLLPSAKSRSQQFIDTQTFNKKYGGVIGTRDVPQLSRRAPKPAWGPGAAKPESTSSSSAPKVTPGPKGSAKTQANTTGGGAIVKSPGGAIAKSKGKNSNLGLAGLSALGTGAILASDQSDRKEREPKQNKSVNAQTLNKQFAGRGGSLAYRAGGGTAALKGKLRPSDIQRKGMAALKSREATPNTAAGFDQAFASARSLGQKEFEWRGGKYTTKLANEEFCSNLVDAVINEGYASDTETAFNLINSMSDEMLLNFLDENLGIKASEVVSQIIGRSGRSGQQVSTDAANLRRNVVRGANAVGRTLKPLGQALVGPGPRSNATDLKNKRRPSVRDSHRMSDK